MAVDAQIIDLRRSYVPIPPDAYPVTEIQTEQEDAPEARIPVIPYDGYNFMPTPQGYASFFGTSATLGTEALASRCDDIFILQTNTFTNVLIALCEDGVWIKSGDIAGDWVHLVTLTTPPAGEHRQYTKCVINNVLYIYRQGEAGILKADPANNYTPTAFVPTFINMAGQIGIFKAGGRLGAWDSENSISWSSLEDTSDFTPSVTTLAGNTIFQDIVGRIVMVLASGTGFVIYCTKSIVRVSRLANSPMLWGGVGLFSENGISYPNECCASEPDSTHFAMTAAGLVQISGTPNLAGTVDTKASFIEPEASTYFKEARLPIYLDYFNGRYLFFQFMDPRYNTGRTIFSETDLAPSTLTFEAAYLQITGYTIGSDYARTIAAIDGAMPSVRLFGVGGFSAYSQAAAANTAMSWNATYITNVKFVDLMAYAAVKMAGGDIDAFFTTNTGDIQSGAGAMDPTGEFTFIDNTTVGLAPSTSPRTFTTAGGANESYAYATTAFAGIGFYAGQQLVWDFEDAFYEDWKTWIRDNWPTDPVTTTGQTVYISAASAPSGAQTATTNESLDAFVDCSFTGVTPPTLGASVAVDPGNGGLFAYNQWMEENVIATTRIDFVSSVVNTPTGAWTEVQWIAVGRERQQFVGSPTALASSCGTLGTLRTYAQASAAEAYLATLFSIGYTIEKLTETTNPRKISYRATSPVAGGPPYNMITEIDFFLATGIANTDTIEVTLPTGAPYDNITNTNVLTQLRNSLPVYRNTNVARSQTLSNPIFQSRPQVPCFDSTLHLIGNTEFAHLGHYTSDLPSSFVSDSNANTGATITDICNLSGVGTYTGNFILNGTRYTRPGTPRTPGSFNGSHTVITIDGYTLEYPGSSVTIPGGTIFLQQGSIAPIYPTLLGAYVFDTHYKKWGKMKLTYSRLLDYYPINTSSGDGVIPYDSFLPRMSALFTNGIVHHFDQYPEDSIITYGKIGYYRKGFTDLEEIRATFRTGYTGALEIEMSVDGREISPALTLLYPYTNLRNIVYPHGASARWYNISFKGNYDLTGLEFRGHRTSRR